MGLDILPSADAHELVDFTCASPWERLALDIELELRAWRLADVADVADVSAAEDERIDADETNVDNMAPPAAPAAMPTPTSAPAPLPPAASTPLTLCGRALSLQLHSFPVASSAPRGWPSAPPLLRLFGLPRYILLTAGAPGVIAADDAADAAVLLSALCVAAAACNCHLPLLVPVGRTRALRFLGRQLAHPVPRRFACDFAHAPSPAGGGGGGGGGEDAATPATPPLTTASLAGLLALFRNKRRAARGGFTAGATSKPLPQRPQLAPPRTTDARVSAHFAYDWHDFSFKLAPAPGTFASHRQLAAAQAAVLASADPIRRIRIAAVWPEFAAARLQRNDALAAMPPASAQCLRLSPPADVVRVLAAPSAVPLSAAPMAAAARAVLRLVRHAPADVAAAADPAAPLPVIDVARCIARSSASAPFAQEQQKQQHSPPAGALDEYLVLVGSYVSVAAIHDDRIDEEFLTSAVAAIFERDLGRGIMVDVVDALGPNAADLSVLERVARLMAVSETTVVATKLWSLFLDGVEVHWEQLWTLEGMSFNVGSGPNHEESLVAQKLQMINCCIDRLRGEQEDASVSSFALGPPTDTLGRKSLLDGMVLIGGGGGGDGGDGASEDCDVWEPYVQPHPLVTRDMVEEEQQRMVLRAEANERSDVGEAKRQSLTLKSDMMAFKAANPGAVLADFVRWFSPSDWIEDDSSPDDSATEAAATTTEGTEAAAPKRRGSGTLSARMSRQGNIWQELWGSAEGVAARRQVPLFDASAHGSKALGDLRAMPLTQVLLHLAIVQADCVTALLRRAFTRPPELPLLCARIDAARLQVRKLSATTGLSARGGSGGGSGTGDGDGDGDGDLDLDAVSAAVDNCALAEYCALLATSVWTKLPPTHGMGYIVDRLATGQFVDVVDDNDRQLVIRMAGLDAGWRSVLLPEVREFLLCGGDGDRMYARLTGDEFRVAFRLSLDYST